MIREVSDHPGIKQSTGGFVGNRSETPAAALRLHGALFNTLLAAILVSALVQLHNYLKTKGTTDELTCI